MFLNTSEIILQLQSAKVTLKKEASSFKILKKCKNKSKTLRNIIGIRIICNFIKYPS